LRRVKDLKTIGICVISKSGSTAETLTNADVLLTQLKEKFGKKLYKQVVCIGNGGTTFMKAYKKRGALTIGMPEIVGGRFSVSTAVGLVPLTMLGHDTDTFIGGLTDANNEEFEEITATAAARIALYTEKKYVHYNFFAFETRLVKLGEWYRQLFAESLGKAKNKKKEDVKGGMLPTISTPVELHSVGQLYLSGFDGVYTDFVTFDDMDVDFTISGKAPAGAYKGKSMQEVATAIYGGVIGAYQDESLPYRSLIFTEDLAYSLGLFMGMRMREVMYVAHLRNLNAFDQPSVESYKKITKRILGT
jgi:glucose-6-phosphate isomerase